MAGACGSPDALYQDCGDAFKTACLDLGGEISVCGPDGSACTASDDLLCKDGSNLYHECDETFITACEKDDYGDFDCTKRCDDGSCCEGKCGVP